MFAPVPGSIARSGAARPRVVIVRGHQANPWELAPWQERAIADRFEVTFLRSRRGWFDVSSLGLDSRRAWTLRDLLPAGPLGDLLFRVPGDRYLRLGGALAGADIVHSQELGYWYSMQAAKLKRSLGFRLVLTVWETIPMLDAYRNVRTRPYRATTLRETDLFLAATERARTSLLLEGAAATRIRVCAPGVAAPRMSSSPGAAQAGADPVILSPGRLVWEKGHQDVLRALALVRGGLLPAAPAAARRARVRIVGTGTERQRLQSYARDLGIEDAVEFLGFVPHEQMPRLYREAACVVLASLPTWSWEEQFGMVVAEAIAAGVPVAASTSGAIPEVAGDRARYFSSGDWPSLAQILCELLARSSAPNPDAAHSLADTADCLAAAYDELLAAA
jgi:glycosyltransferase involved in cell wall biosynthesis